MNTPGLVVIATTAATAAVVLRYVLRPAPGADLPPLARPPAGSDTHVHRDGLPWCDWQVRVPPRLHRCWAHSGGWKRTTFGPAWYERCPCGGERFDNGRWRARNSHRMRDGDRTIYLPPDARRLP